jgi:hypothetical protein
MHWNSVPQIYWGQSNNLALGTEHHSEAEEPEQLARTIVSKVKQRKSKYIIDQLVGLTMVSLCTRHYQHHADVEWRWRSYFAKCALETSGLLELKDINDDHVDTRTSTRMVAREMFLLMKQVVAVDVQSQSML